MRILVVEPDPSLFSPLKEQLRKGPFVIHILRSPRVLSKIEQETQFDLLVFDADVPEALEDAFLATIRKHWPNLPYILLSSTNSTKERVRGLNDGADDYLLKPIVAEELTARIHAVLRRRDRSVPDVYKLENLEANRITHRVSRGGRTIALSPREYELLDFLLFNVGRPVSRTAIIQQVWQADADAFTNIVDVYINYLRRKIDFENQPALIHTVHGIGYQIGGK
jgi:two-component system, OmpR family, copper resistance phosphate regulon response regulator CusR